MGYRGLVRSFIAAARESERQARRRQAELIRQQKYLDKMAELERAEYEAGIYENKIELLQTIHKECGELIVWEGIAQKAPPNHPIQNNSNEEIAIKKYNDYKPSIIDILFKKVEKKKQALLLKIEEGKQIDKQEYQKILRKYEEDYSSWQDMKDLASRILSGDTGAYEEVINGEDPFKEIKQFGSEIQVHCFNKDIVITNVGVHSIDFIPSEIKTVLKSGKLSIKPMPQSKRNELYQDYACSCAIRVAREVFSLVPAKLTIVNVISRVLNKKTGHRENAPILSAAISRQTLESLNLETIDPSDSMTNFVHNMSFKKSEGLNIVETLKPEDFT